MIPQGRIFRCKLPVFFNFFSALVNKLLINYLDIKERHHIFDFIIKFLAFKTASYSSLFHFLSKLESINR